MMHFIVLLIEIIPFCSCGVGLVRPLIIISLFGSAIQWNPSFSNHLGKGKFIRIIGRLETSGVKIYNVGLVTEEKLH